MTDPVDSKIILFLLFQDHYYGTNYKQYKCSGRIATNENTYNDIAKQGGDRNYV